MGLRRQKESKIKRFTIELSSRLSKSLVLPLLFLTVLPAFSQVTVYGETGTLFVNNDGGSAYALGGISLRRVQKDGEVWADFGVLGAGSDLSAINVSPFVFAGRLGFNTANFGVDLTGGAFHHKALSSNAPDVPIDSEGGAGAFLSMRLPLRFQDFTIEPSVFWGNAAWEDGSFYWFLGKPDLPEAKVFGLSTVYKAHSASFYSASLGLNIVGNDEIPLFISEIHGFAGFYAFSFGTQVLKLTASTGWAYAEGSLDGALTASNQRYWLFPYISYHINGELDANVGVCALFLRLSPTRLPYFHLEASAAALYIFSGSVSWSSRYQRKNLFNGRKGYSSGVRNISDKRAAFLHMDARWSTSGKTPTTFGLRKAFIIPWDFEKQKGIALSSSSNVSSELLRVILLSGFSLYVTRQF